MSHRSASLPVLTMPSSVSIAAAEVTSQSGRFRPALARMVAGQVDQRWSSPGSTSEKARCSSAAPKGAADAARERAAESSSDDSMFTVVLRGRGGHRGGMLAGGLAGKGVCDTRDKDGVHRSLLPVSARWPRLWCTAERRSAQEHTPDRRSAVHGGFIVKPCATSERRPFAWWCSSRARATAGRCSRARRLADGPRRRGRRRRRHGRGHEPAPPLRRARPPNRSAARGRPVRHRRVRGRADACSTRRARTPGRRRRGRVARSSSRARSTSRTS